MKALDPERIIRAALFESFQETDGTGHFHVSQGYLTGALDYLRLPEDEKIYKKYEYTARFFDEDKRRAFWGFDENKWAVASPPVFSRVHESAKGTPSTVRDHERPKVGRLIRKVVKVLKNIANLSIGKET